MVKHPLALVALTAALVTVAVISTSHIARSDTDTWRLVVGIDVPMFGPTTNFVFEDHFDNEPSCRLAIEDPEIQQTIKDLYDDMLAIDAGSTVKGFQCIDLGDPA